MKNPNYYAGAAMLMSALLFWICDVSDVIAACLGAAALCFLSAGYTSSKKPSGEDS